MFQFWIEELTEILTVTFDWKWYFVTESEHIDLIILVKGYDEVLNLVANHLNALINLHAQSCVYANIE